MSVCTPSWLRGAGIKTTTTQRQSPLGNLRRRWTTGNPNARLPSLTRGGVTNNTDCCRSWGSPYPPKVETVKNQFFQDHHTSLCRNIKMSSFKTTTPSQAVSLSPGGVQKVQALIPRQTAEFVTPPLICKGSLVSRMPAGDSSSGFQGDLSHSQECMQWRHSFPGRQC